MQNNKNTGWTEEMNSIHDLFHFHGTLLLTLRKLDFITSFECNFMQRSFEQATWAQIRDGNDSIWQ